MRALISVSEGTRTPVGRFWHHRRMARTPRLTRLGALVLALLAAAGLTAGCDTTFPGTSLRIATGVPTGVYSKLGGALATAWEGQLDLAPSDVKFTNGSGENVQLLLDGEVDVAFSAADVATEPRVGEHGVLALARIYDDYLHVVVRSDGPIHSLGELAGKRVSVGTRDSGTSVIAKRVLKVTGLPTQITEYNLDESMARLQRGEVDAFFWSGGLPTGGITAAGDSVRLVDLAEELPAIREQFPIYNASSVPAAVYGSETAVTTLAVPNFLLVSDLMSDDVAEALVSGMFAARGELVRANRAAQAIDVLPGIETDPVPLHPGAVRYYREADI
ncbi:TRAP transporter solute receptor, TAXI family precursor [Actinokineospora spheciospongiae]|uniref:TRAP transporter solute receptor, TAXI family n=2 Tax=Actinokineospora spheciospongiae TaxID=909613 RepID=W7INZ9_9PSEU|nr:TRAP transporter solute receptor, TAXI family precursor [Actinokineospora spheciospongiae]